jgi:hypothetical protein
MGIVDSLLDKYQNSLEESYLKNSSMLNRKIGLEVCDAIWLKKAQDPDSEKN